MTDQPAHCVDAAGTHRSDAPSDQVLDQLVQLEPLTHRGKSGTTRAGFEALTAQDFWEVGASGRCYDREFIWSALERRSAEPTEEPWDTSESRCRQLSTDTYLLTYLLRQDERLTRRATIWHLGATGWQVIYHQGTVVSQA